MERPARALKLVESNLSTGNSFFNDAIIGNMYAALQAALQAGAKIDDNKFSVSDSVLDKANRSVQAFGFEHFHHFINVQGHVLDAIVAVQRLHKLEADPDDPALLQKAQISAALFTASDIDLILKHWDVVKEHQAALERHGILLPVEAAER